MKIHKLKFLLLSICCLISILCSGSQCMDEEIQKIQAGGSRYLRDSQSEKLSEDNAAKNENDKLGIEARRIKNQVGRGYINNPNQQEILKEKKKK